MTYKHLLAPGGVSVKMNLNLGEWWQAVAQRVAPPQREKAPPVPADLQGQVESAHREWVAAQQYFQSVSEPALVDYAIFMLVAAERKYMYLLNQLRGQKPAEGGRTPWIS